MANLIEALGKLDPKLIVTGLFFVGGFLFGLGCLIIDLYNRWCNSQEKQLEAVKCQQPGYFEIEKAEKAWEPHRLAVLALKEHLAGLKEQFDEYNNQSGDAARMIFEEMSKVRADLTKLGLELPRPDQNSMPVEGMRLAHA